MNHPLDTYDSANQGWTRREATHLLWRCAGGASHAEITTAVADGLEKTLDRLLNPQPESLEFVTTEKLLHRAAQASGSIEALKHWWLYRLLHSANPLVERMMLFWHNHFATSNAKVRSTEKMAAQNALIRQHALGSFRRLFHGMARDVAMLVWLDGNANRKRHPNENFAREVMELFSLGVGNYSEMDIKEAARAFTGWHVRNDVFWFNKSQHDTGTKTVLTKSGPLKGDDVLDICLEQPACPQHLAKKLLQTFVHPDPDIALLDALAAVIRKHDYEMTPVLRNLFGSKTFYAPAARRSLIKSPVDLVLGAFKSMGGRAHLEHCVQLMSDLGQNLFEPPTVKGWEGGRQWINSATMLQRANFAAEFSSGSRFGKRESADPRFQSASETVDYWSELLLAHELEVDAKRELASIENQADLIPIIMTLPEYQLI